MTGLLRNAERGHAGHRGSGKQRGNFPALAGAIGLLFIECAGRASFLPFHGRSFKVFLHSKLHHFAYQAERNWLIQGKLHRAFCSFIGKKLLPEFLVPRRRCIKPDVLFECAEMHQITAQNEGWQSILDRFHCGWRRFSNRRPQSSLLTLLAGTRCSGGAAAKAVVGIV